MCVRLGPGHRCVQSCFMENELVFGVDVRRGWVQSGQYRNVHKPRNCASRRETFTIPLIPLGLKETKDVDFSVVLKVNLKAMGAGITVFLNTRVPEQGAGVVAPGFRWEMGEVLRLET